jgi:hypothetical protein
MEEPTNKLIEPQIKIATSPAFNIDDGDGEEADDNFDVDIQPPQGQQNQAVIDSKEYVQIKLPSGTELVLGSVKYDCFALADLSFQMLNELNKKDKKLKQNYYVG